MSYLSFFQSIINLPAVDELLQRVPLFSPRVLYMIPGIDGDTIYFPQHQEHALLVALYHLPVFINFFHENENEWNISMDEGRFKLIQGLHSML